MINAKKNIGESRADFCIKTSGSDPRNKPNTTTDANAATKKLNTKSQRINFRITNRPPITTKGNIEAVPIHQLAD